MHTLTAPVVRLCTVVGERLQVLPAWQVHRIAASDTARKCKNQC